MCVFKGVVGGRNSNSLHAHPVLLCCAVTVAWAMRVWQAHSNHSLTHTASTSVTTYRTVQVTLPKYSRCGWTTREVTLEVTLTGCPSPPRGNWSLPCPVWTQVPSLWASLCGVLCYSRSWWPTWRPCLAGSTRAQAFLRLCPGASRARLCPPRDVQNSCVCIHGSKWKC